MGLEAPMIVQHHTFVDLLSLKVLTDVMQITEG